MRLPPADSALVQIVDAHLADAARRAGPMLACRVGCTHCCHGAFPINMLDALRLRAGLAELRSSDPLTAEAVEFRARAWIAAHRERFPGDPETGLLAAEDECEEGFEDFSADAACPALNPVTGGCDLYAWRPMTCRVFGPPVRSVAETGEEGLGHCELCFIGATSEQVSACEMQVPHELEEKLVEEVTGESGGSRETVVAFALVHRSFDAASDDSLRGR
jgi:Fe-S-cluster containining protein